jgi:type IV pilus assembly protein PilC
MASEFICRVGTADGRVLEQVFQGRDEVAVKAEVARRGLHLFTMRRRGLSLGSLLPRFGRGRIQPRTFLVFNQELAALLKAGLPLLQTLDLLLERMQDVHFRSILTDIRGRVSSGADLSQAFAAHGDVFPPLYASTLKAGERTGELEQVVRRFIRYQKLVLEARRRVIGALVYPIVLVCLSITMIVVMMIYVVPKFTAFFSDLEVELPLITRVSLGLSAFLQRWWPGLLGGGLAGWFFLRRYAATAGGRVAIDRLRLRVPVLGDVFKRFALSEYARSLSTLLAGGIPLVQALEVATSAVGNAWVRGELEPAIGEVRQGKTFHGALETIGLFDSLAIDMVKVGETTGALDTMLQSVAEFLDEEVETRMQRLLTLIEPLMLVFMGLIVATLLVSIYLPLFNSLGQSQSF